MHEVAQRPSERESLEVDLLPLNGFDSNFKFTREDNDWQIVSGVASNIVHCLLVNYHDVTGRTYDGWISRQISYENLKWHNQPGEKNKGLLESLRSHGTIQNFCSVHTELWIATHLNFPTVVVVWFERGTLHIPHKFSSGWKFVRCALWTEPKIRCRRRSINVPNLTDELSMANERRLNQQTFL